MRYGDGAKENLLKRTGYFLFYRLLRAISDLDIPLDSGDFCLMDRRVVDVLKHLPERQRFVRGLRTFVGFRQCGVAYDRPAREAGVPKYTLWRLLQLALDGLVSFSSLPLTLAAYLGAFSAGLALLLTLWMLLVRRSDPATPHGWMSTMIVVLFMGSLHLFTQAIMGAYLRRIFLECKGRPTYILRDDWAAGQERAQPVPPSRNTERRCPVISATGAQSIYRFALPWQPRLGETQLTRNDESKSSPRGQGDFD